MQLVGEKERFAIFAWRYFCGYDMVVSSLNGLKELVALERAQLEERIRLCSSNSDQLIIRLNTLADRIDTAKGNNNPELVAHYQEEFTKVSMEFMAGVETILDDWYALNGQKRSRMEDIPLTGDALQTLHAHVLHIVSGNSASIPLAPRSAEVEEAAPAEDKPESTRKGRADSGHKVDLRG